MPKGYTNNGQKRRVPPEKRCAVCQHPERHRVEALHCAGVSLDRLAEKFPPLNWDAIWRHCARHLTDMAKASYLAGPKKIAELAEVAAEESESVLDYLRILRSALMHRLDKIAAGSDTAGMAAISAQLINVLNAIGKATGQISQMAGTVINITNNTAILNSPPFADLQSGLLQIAARHPAARADIVTLFRDLDAKYAGQTASTPPLKTIEAARESARA